MVYDYQGIPHFMIGEQPDVATTWRPNQCKTTNVVLKEEGQLDKWIFPKYGTMNNTVHNPYPTTGRHLIASYTARFEQPYKTNIPEIFAASTCHVDDFASQRGFQYYGDHSTDLNVRDEYRTGISLISPLSYKAPDQGYLTISKYIDNERYPNLKWWSGGHHTYCRPRIKGVNLSQRSIPMLSVDFLWLDTYPTSYRIDMVAYAFLLFDSERFFHQSTPTTYDYNFTKTDVQNYFVSDNDMIVSPHYAPFKFSALCTIHETGNPEYFDNNKYDNQYEWISSQQNPKYTFHHGSRIGAYAKNNYIQGDHVPNIRYLGDYMFGTDIAGDPEKYALVLATDKLDANFRELWAGTLEYDSGFYPGRVSTPFINAGFIGNTIREDDPAHYHMGVLGRGIYILEIGCEYFFTPI